jgi:hypothetical protein
MVVYLLRGVVSTKDAGRLNDDRDLRASPHLSPLALEAANALLSPLGSHLDCRMLVGGVDAWCAARPTCYFVMRICVMVVLEEDQLDFREGELKQEELGQRAAALWGAGQVITPQLVSGRFRLVKAWLRKVESFRAGASKVGSSGTEYLPLGRFEITTSRRKVREGSSLGQYFPVSKIKCLPGYLTVAFFASVSSHVP